MPFKNHFLSVGLPLFGMIGMGSIVIITIRQLNYSPFVNNSQKDNKLPSLEEDISNFTKKLKPNSDYVMK